jgi:hypothetical protein
MKDSDQQIRLRRFWGTTAFSFGILWGFSNLVYSPIAILTSVKGSSWLEVFVVLAGGIFTLCASIGAFYKRRGASLFLLIMGPILLIVAVAGQAFLQRNAHGVMNLLLLYLSGVTAILLGIFGMFTEHYGWPPLRENL